MNDGEFHGYSRISEYYIPIHFSWLFSDKLSHTTWQWFHGYSRISEFWNIIYPFIFPGISRKYADSCIYPAISMKFTITYIQSILIPLLPWKMNRCIVFQISCYSHEIHHHSYEIDYHPISMKNGWVYSVTLYTWNVQSDNQAWPKHRQK